MVKQLAGAEQDAPGDVERPRRRIPEATVARLPLYLRSLLEAAEAKTTTVSSERLAELAGVNAAKVRKDLSYLGSYGTRGVGYDVEYLLFQISRELGLTALVDSDPAKRGEAVAGLRVRGLDELPAVVADERIAIGIVATPASVAQEVADRLVAAGVTSILNFAPVVLSVPTDVSLRKVDLSIELQILSYYQQRRMGAGEAGAAISELTSVQ
jgi:redox-sensing transcriptional repressor